MINKNFVFFFLFYFFINFFYCVELTEKEEEYLNQKIFFSILVSSNNYPYEYINNDGIIDGINIRFIKEILAFTNLLLEFNTDYEDNQPDFLSSFTPPHDLYNIHTEPIYTSSVYFLYDKNYSLNDIDYFITINQSLLLHKIIEKYPNKIYLLMDELVKPQNIFGLNKKSVLVFDSFNRRFFSETINSRKEVELSLQNDLELHFYLSVQSDNQILYGILSKAIQDLEEKNIFYDKYTYFRDVTTKIYFFDKYNRVLLITIIVVFVFLIIYLLAFYKYKVLTQNIQSVITKYKVQNISLESQIESLTCQLGNIFSSNLDLLQKINNLSFIIDLHGTIIHINDYCKPLLGYNPNEMIGQNIINFTSKEGYHKLLALSSSKLHIPNSRNQLENQYNQESQNQFEIEIATKDGLKRSFIYTTFLSKSAKSNTEVNCILLNITDRKILQNKLDSLNNHLDEMIKQRLKTVKESEERFAFIIEKAFNGIFALKDDILTIVNEALTVLTGYPKSSFSEKLVKFSDIIDTADYDSVKEKIDTNLMKNIDYFIVQTRIKSIAGDLTDVEIHLTLTMQNDEAIILGVIHDISIKKEFEERKLQTERLNMLTQYAVTTNDKINSPLNAISGYIELLELGIKKPTPRDINAFSNIYESINIIKRVLHQLKTLTKVTQTQYNFAGLSAINLGQENSSDKETNSDE